MIYADSSPLLKIALDPAPDVARLSAAVWKRVKGKHGEAYTRYSEAEVCGSADYEGIVPAYVRVSADTGLDAYLMLAMMLHETGSLSSWWAAKPRRNPAGVFVSGATRTTLPPANEGDLWQRREAALWVRGQAYPNWVSSPGYPWRPNSVEAHLYRVLGYAKATLDAGRQAGYVRACEGRPLPLFCRGSARTPRELGQRHNRHYPLAGWAWPGTHYGASIAAIANTLI